MYCNKALFEVSEILFMQKYISAQDFNFIYEATKRTSPEFPYWQYENIDMQLQHMNDDDCLAEFRVSRSELDALPKALMIPGQFRCPNGTITSGLEGLCIILRRFAYPCRFDDMIHRFGRSVPQLSLIASEVVDFIYATHGYLLRTSNQPWLEAQCLEEFANTAHQHGAALTNCWGFVDGTVRPISRPCQHQRVVYNSHKRVHTLKFQSIVAPNGLIANLYGPVGEFC